MCYSAQIKADYQRFVRLFGARISIRDFFDIYWRRANEDTKIRLPKAMDAMFTTPGSDDEREVAALIGEHNTAEAARFEQELFKQRKRLADAERALATKPTKAATESNRIATDKTEWCLSKLAALRRPDDERAGSSSHDETTMRKKEGRQINSCSAQARLHGRSKAAEDAGPS